jgi:hypothetical protein
MGQEAKQTNPPPVDLNVIRLQLALITDYLQTNVWKKDEKENGSEDRNRVDRLNVESAKGLQQG